MRGEQFRVARVDHGVRVTVQDQRARPDARLPEHGDDVADHVGHGQRAGRAVIAPGA